MYKLFMALRYLLAHKIIYFSIAGVALGIMTLVVVTSIMGGFSRDMRARIRGMQTDLVVTSYDRGTWFEDYDALCDEISKVPHVVGCAPRIEYGAWLGRGGVRRDVHVVGIVPERERGVSDLEKYFVEGGKRSFDFRDDDGRPTASPGLVLGIWAGLRAPFEHSGAGQAALIGLYFLALTFIAGMAGASLGSLLVRGLGQRRAWQAGVAILAGEVLVAALLIAVLA